jgi:outer membrane protein OmpA-like peptidoglycan-associated protein
MKMHKWLVVLAMGLFVTFSAVAQDKTGDAADNGITSATAAGSTSAAPATSDAASVAPAASNIFAVPMPPRATPFPAPSPSLGITGDPVGRLVPKFELAFLFQYVNFTPGDPFKNFNSYGGSGEIVYNANHWLGIVGQGAGYTFTRDLSPIASSDTQLTNPSSTDGGYNTLLFGPRLNLRRFDHFVPFGEFLIGFAHGGGAVTGSGSQYAFALAAGGGLDLVLWKNIAWRVAELDYLLTNFTGAGVSATSRQNNFRAGSGIVLRFGFAAPPPPPNHPPVAACAANPASVFAGSGASVQVHVNASDPDNDQLTYSYTATGGTVDGTGPDARWSSSGLNAGTFTVNAKVDDGKGGTATCSADIAVQPKPNQPPTISCSTDRSPIMPGERTGITATASDPDGDPLTYSYAPSGGQIVGSGPKVEFDSTGLQPGSYTVKCSVSDGKGGNADASTNVDVQQPPPAPQATKVGDCGYTKVGASRFDNLCKRVGDDVALRLKNDPNAKVVIVGFADPKEPKAAKLAAARAELAKKYLGEKGIDASRISTRTGEAAGGAEKDNRRVDFIFVPDGATY